VSVAPELLRTASPFAMVAVVAVAVVEPPVVLGEGFTFSPARKK
jgi:hypothetical protein